MGSMGCLTLEPPHTHCTTHIYRHTLGGHTPGLSHPPADPQHVHHRSLMRPRPCSSCRGRTARATAPVASISTRSGRIAPTLAPTDTLGWGSQSRCAHRARSPHTLWYWDAAHSKGPPSDTILRACEERPLGPGLVPNPCTARARRPHGAGAPGPPRVSDARPGAVAPPFCRAGGDG